MSFGKVQDRNFVWSIDRRREGFFPARIEKLRVEPQSCTLRHIALCFRLSQSVLTARSHAKRSVYKLVGPYLKYQAWLHLKSAGKILKSERTIRMITRSQDKNKNNRDPCTSSRDTSAGTCCTGRPWPEGYTAEPTGMEKASLPSLPSLPSPPKPLGPPVSCMEHLEGPHRPSQKRASQDACTALLSRANGPPACTGM